MAHGQTRLAALLLPLSIDGTVAAASLVMLQAARSGVATPWLARFMLALAVAATLAANVGYGLPFGLPGALISGWPAVAFVGSVEMVLSMVRRARRGAPATAPEGASAPALGSAAVLNRRARPAASRTRTRPSPVTADDAEHEFMADLASGALPSLRSIRARMHVGQDRARQLREHLETVTGRT